jgi:phage tail-like protein
MAHRFWVEVQGVTQAYFRECSGLELSTAVEVYEEGGLTISHQLPGRTTVGRVTLRKGLAEPDDLWTWYSDVINGTIRRRSVTISLYENTVEAAGKLVVSWTLVDALPVRWVAPVMGTDEVRQAVDQLEFICRAINRESGSGYR